MTTRVTDSYDAYGPPAGPGPQRVVTSQTGLWHWLRPSSEHQPMRGGRVYALCKPVEPVWDSTRSEYRTPVRWCIKCRNHPLSPLPPLPTKRRHDD